jgi:hypothetical protein
MTDTILNRRRFLFLGAMTAAGGVLALAAAPAEAALPRLLPPLPEAPPDALSAEPALHRTPDPAAEALLEEVQWGPPVYRGPPPHRGPPPGRGRRRRRCWTENVRVRYVDRFGRPFWRIEPRQVCR